MCVPPLLELSAKVAFCYPDVAKYIHPTPAPLHGPVFVYACECVYVCVCVRSVRVLCCMSFSTACAFCTRMFYPDVAHYMHPPIQRSLACVPMRVCKRACVCACVSIYL